MQGANPGADPLRGVLTRLGNPVYPPGYRTRAPGYAPAYPPPSAYSAPSGYAPPSAYAPPPAYAPAAPPGYGAPAATSDDRLPGSARR